MPSRLLGLFLLFSTPLYAEIIVQEMSNGLLASAEFRSGEAEKPLLLFVHAFLQTRNFPTSKRLAEALGEEGYPILSPTLTLGISDRRNSLACESLQLHSIDQEAAEIARWIDWAVRQGYADIQIIGHSAGSVSTVAYLDQFRGRIPENVRKVTLISLTHYGPDRPAAFETTELERKARELQQQHRNEPVEFALSFCEKYPARPDDYLSYLNYSAAKVQEVIANAPIETHVVLGDKDLRIDRQWAEQLKNHHARVYFIEGANHFFDQSHEFDLLDVIGEIIEAP